MIDQAAKNICKDIYRGNFDELSDGEPLKEVCRDIARAAIEAMRKPTGEMIVNLKADMLAGVLPLRAYKNLLDKALDDRQKAEDKKMSFPVKDLWYYIRQDYFDREFHPEAIQGDRTLNNMVADIENMSNKELINAINNALLHKDK